MFCMVQEFLQALAIIADECSMELIDAAVQLGADPARLQGIALCPNLYCPLLDSNCLCAMSQVSALLLSISEFYNQ